MTNHSDVTSISVRLNVLGLLARNSLQGGKERQSRVFWVMYVIENPIVAFHTSITLQPDNAGTRSGMCLRVSLFPRLPVSS